MLLLALAAGAAIFGYAKLGHPATASGATPAPAPTPTPRPTVTQTVAPHVTGPNFTLPVHLTGGDIVAMFVVGGIVAIVIILGVLRRGDS